jgi:hypothetical protein
MYCNHQYATQRSSQQKFAPMPDELKSAIVQLRIQPSLKKAAERAAAAERRSLTTLVEIALVEWLRAHGYMPPAKPSR